MKSYYVYILSGRTRMLYIGITSDIARRMHQHRSGSVEGFASKFKLGRLVHLETFDDAASAITREKPVKGWTRSKKISLIESTNPKWIDLAPERK